MVLYTKAGITATTITATIIINSKRAEPKTVRNVLSLRRSITFQSQLKVHMYVYVNVYI